MSRIRTIKPEIFRHEELQELGALAMLFFVGLWTVADRNGVFPFRPKQLKLDILPFIDYDPEEVLASLEAAGFVEAFGDGAREWGVIPSFTRHQRITGTEAKNGSRYPSPPVSSGTEETPRQQHGSTKEALRKHKGSTKETLRKQHGCTEKEREREREREKEREKEYPTGTASQGSTDLVTSPRSVARKDELPPAMLETYHAAKAAFEGSAKAAAMIYQDPASTARELKALKTLVQRAHKIAPEAPGAFLACAMSRYRDLVNGKLSGKAAWTPSGLATAWTWSLVLEGMQAEPTAEERELEKAVAGLFARKVSA